jgi:hypothetical protein
VASDGAPPSDAVNSSPPDFGVGSGVGSMIISSDKLAVPVIWSLVIGI